MYKFSLSTCISAYKTIILKTQKDGKDKSEKMRCGDGYSKIQAVLQFNDFFHAISNAGHNIPENGPPEEVCNGCIP